MRRMNFCSYVPLRLDPGHRIYFVQWLIYAAQTLSITQTDLFWQFGQHYRKHLGVDLCCVPHSPEDLSGLMFSYHRGL